MEENLEMASESAAAENAAGSQRNRTYRGTYEKPAVIYRAPLEAMAGLCGSPPSGKANSVQCGGVTIQS